MTFHTQFRFRPGDWRLWFDSVMGLWRAQRWDGDGGIISSDRVESAHCDFVCEGKFIRVPNCEIKHQLTNFIDDFNVVVPVMRLCPPSQMVEVPNIAMKGSARVG